MGPVQRNEAGTGSKFQKNQDQTRKNRYMDGFDTRSNLHKNDNIN